MEKYNPAKIELRWHKEWEKSGIYKTQDFSQKPKFYALDFFPYPSGEGLHVGHTKGYIATDIAARKKMMEGYSVLHPMGWDAFGLPTENFAIKHKIHPRIATEKNIANFKKQMDKIGFTYDWEREINTTNPEFYKWTQWIFLKMFEKGLAYESDEPVNWCPSCKTVLANEDLEAGRCERCGTEVVQKKMRQWVLKMTAYADRLLYDLDKENLDWEELIKEQQRNWIGRSEGAQFQMKIKSSDEKIEVYTTRLDTVFGMTYVVVAPEHPIISNLILRQAQDDTERGRSVKSQISNFEEVEKYIIAAQNKTELERTGLAKEKTGVELKGIKAINPFTNEEIPVWVADYVLGSYGTGAVMAVPAHDERDFEFAKKYGLPIKKTIKSQDKKSSAKEKAYVEDGILINSGQYAGLTSAKAREEMTEWLEEKGIGKKKVNYKMRDWVFSRQRYWGEPIPIIHCAKCGAVAVPEKNLPVKLPDVKSYEPTGTGESPLANIKEWVNVKCPKCDGPAKRETNTMPQWAGSSWYYLRYIDPRNKKALLDKKKEKYWMPVDLYVGGAEHATRHLLYARFWHKFLYDIGVVYGKEPFKKLVHVGLINGEDGRKMSKRWGNVINPDDVVAEFGADTLRLYEMFMGPFTQNISWSTKSVNGMRRFLERVWALSQIQNPKSKNDANSKEENGRVERLLHKTIKKVTEDIEDFKFNTAISALMVLANEMEKTEDLFLIHYSIFLILLSPFAPHIAEELWHNLGNEKSIFLESWPKYDPQSVKEEEIDLVVQINGKLKDRVRVPADISEDDAKKTAMQSGKVKKAIDNEPIKKVIFVKGRLINIVV